MFYVEYFLVTILISQGVGHVTYSTKFKVTPTISFWIEFRWSCLNHPKREDALCVAYSLIRNAD